MYGNLINQMLVSTECIIDDDNREYGTGVLIPTVSDKYDYVFTALHCIKGKEYCDTNKFNLYSETFGVVDCDPEDIYIIRELDIAIVKTKKLLEDNWIDIEEPTEEESGYFIGYPQLDEGNRCHMRKIRVNFSDDSKIKVQIGEINLGRARPVQVLGGFSGSPVFLERYNTICLSSVIIELTDADLRFNELNYISIKEFYRIIKEHNLEQIRTENPNMMETCISKTFVSEEAEELYDLLLNYARKINGIKMHYFIDWLKEKMFLPYGQYPTTNENVWIGWIKFLTFMYIISEEEFIDSGENTFDENKFFDYIKKCRDEGIKYFHSYDCKTFADLLPILYRNYNIYKDLKGGDAVIANFGKNNPSKAYIPRTEIANVVKNITHLDNELEKDNLDISSPSVNKSLDVLHIYHFESRIMSNWNYETKVRELKPMIKRSIEEVIKDVKGM